MSETALERFSRGDRFAVDPDSIERELAAVWREAGRSNHHGARPVTRACLWNVVAHEERRPDGEGHLGAATLMETIQALPQHVASRALVLRTEASDDDRPEIESWISANCALSPDGNKVVCSEEITVASRGEGDRHLTSLVHALLVPDVPTAAVFAGVPPTGGIIDEDVLDVADRVVTRVDGSSQPRPLRRIHELLGRTPLGIMDLGWISQSGLRTLVAELFEPPATDADWRGVESVTVRAQRAAKSSARLMLGWIGASLGARDPSRCDEQQWRLDANGRDLYLELVDDESPGTAGISRIELSAERQSYVTKAMDHRHWLMVPGHRPARQCVLDVAPLAEQVATALRSRRTDPDFMNALVIGSALE